MDWWDGMGHDRENDYEMVHRWAWNESESISSVVNYKAKIRSDRIQYPSDSFTQMLTRIETWPEWAAVTNVYGMPVDKAAPGLDDLSGVLEPMPSPSRQQIIEALNGNHVVLAASESHWQVVYGYTIEETTGAVRALVWDPKGSNKELFLMGDWFQIALIVRP